MTAAENMARILNKSGAYRLDGEGLVDWELAAYGAGLQVLAGQASQLEQEVFLQNAPPARLAEWEKLCFSQVLTAGIADRRAVLCQWLAHRRGPVTPEELPGLLLAAGIKGTAAEGQDGLSVTVEGYLLPQAQAQEKLRALIPANVPLAL